MHVVLPGDPVSVETSTSAASTSGSSNVAALGPRTIKLGPGLLQLSARARSKQRALDEGEGDNATPRVIATKAGVLGHVAQGTKSEVREREKADRWWVETNTKRYVPAASDSVVASVASRGSEVYSLSLGSSTPGTLSVLAFEGATKRNRPNLKVGSVLYARVTLAERDAEPELTCVVGDAAKAEGYGELKVPEREEGVCMVFRCSLGLARSLLDPGHPLLPSLARHFPFETAIGFNGRIWVRAGNVRHVIAFGRVLDAADRVQPRSKAQVAASMASKAAKRRARKRRAEEMDVSDEEGTQEEEDDNETDLGVQAPAVGRGVLSDKEIKRIVELYI